MKKFKLKGFTLVELLVVIAIVGLLSSMGTYYVNFSTIRARDARRLADNRVIQQALELFYDDNGHYPKVHHALVLGKTGCGDTGSWCELENALNGTDIDPLTAGNQPGNNYLDKLPRPPLNELTPNYDWYRYDSNPGDGYQTYGFMQRLEYPLGLGGSEGYLTANDGGHYAGYYETGQQPAYCQNKYGSSGNGDWWGDYDTTTVCRDGN